MKANDYTTFLRMALPAVAMLPEVILSLPQVNALLKVLCRK